MPATPELNSIIRQIIDPQILRLRNELYGDNKPYSATIKPSMVPKSVITDTLNESLDDVIDARNLFSAVSTFTAGAAITAGRVCVLSGSSVVHADNTNAAHGGKVIGIALTDAANGAQVDVQQIGEVVFPSFANTPGQVYYVGTNGFLVTAGSLGVGAVILQPVGIATSATGLYIRPSLMCLELV